MKDVNPFILEHRPKMDIFLEGLPTMTPIEKTDVVEEPILTGGLTKAFNTLCYQMYFSQTKLKSVLLSEAKNPVLNQVL